MRGGYRENSGRKKGYSAIEAEKAREYIAERVSTSLEQLIDSLLKKAQEGDLKATHLLFERAWGRPAQEVRSIITQETSEEPSERIKLLAEKLNQIHKADFL